MNFRLIRTAPTGRARCVFCREPILKKEGIISWTGYGGGVSCFKCSIKKLEGWIATHKDRIKKLKRANHIGKERMNQLKIARML